MHFIPTVILKKNSKEYAYDIFSRLLEDRIIMLCGEINDEMASSIVSQLLYLESLDSQADIDMYIHSPGGSVSAGLAIFDTMNFVKCDVSTISIGLSPSMSAFLLAAGKKGKRFALENSEIILAYEQKFRFKPSVTVLYKEGERIDIKEIVIKTDGIRAVSRYIEDNNIIKYLMYINFINLCLIPIIMKTKKIKI